MTSISKLSSIVGIAAVLVTAAVGYGQLKAKVSDIDKRSEQNSKKSEEIGELVSGLRTGQELTIKSLERIYRKLEKIDDQRK